MLRRNTINEADLLKAVIRCRAETGRCSQQDLADKLGVSKPGVRYRLHQLHEEGIICLERDNIRPTDPLVSPITVTLSFVVDPLSGAITYPEDEPASSS